MIKPHESNSVVYALLHFSSTNPSLAIFSFTMWMYHMHWRYTMQNGCGARTCFLDIHKHHYLHIQNRLRSLCVPNRRKHGENFKQRARWLFDVKSVEQKCLLVFHITCFLWYAAKSNDVLWFQCACVCCVFVCEYGFCVCVCINVEAATPHTYYNPSIHIYRNENRRKAYTQFGRC